MREAFFHFHTKGDKTMKMLSSFSLLLCVLLLAVPAFAFAEDAANYKDTQTELQLRIERGEIVGPHMVYSGVDKQGISQIFYRNLETGQQKQITDTPMDKHHTQIAVNSNGQVVMVWNETDEKLSFFDVYSHNLSTGVTKKLNQTAGVYLGLQTDGDYAIFKNSRDQYAPAVLVKLSDGSQTLLDNATSRSGTFLHKGKVVFENLDDHSVQLVDLAAGTMTQIYKADGFYPDVMDFNGKYCLMHANNTKNRQYKYMILNVETGQTTDLDDWGPNLTWGGSAIGDHYAAYLTKKDGSGEVIINWVDLTAGRVQEMKGPATQYAYFMFDGDQLLMNGMNKKDKLIYRTLNGTEDKLGALLPKPAPITPAFKAEVVSKTIGEKGAALTPPSGKAVLAVAKGTFSKNAKVTLTSSQVTTGKSTLVSTAWIVASDQKWKKGVALTLSYDSSLAAGRSLVMAQYDAKSASWKPVSSKTDAKKKTVTASISFAGTYAIIVK
jgi:hypothetical protein